ncbi:MAG TPA: carboxypeptidase-like regulatory domain-containing protein, partial [Micromonosporaceae bacterium]
SAPIAAIGRPEIGTTWKVGDTITFAGHARDPQQGNLPDSALTWHLRMQHCYAPGNCHAHVIEDFIGVSSGSFVAPDHEYPSYLELELVATDAQGLTSSYVQRLNPRTVDLTFTSNPPGRQLSVGAVTQTAPFTVRLIQGSTTTVSAPSPQQSGLTTYTFGGWSDGKARSHSIIANSDATYTATFSSTTALCADTYGYTCSTVEAQPYLSADTQLAVQGDDGGAVLTLPFAFPFYDTTHTSVWADVNGLVSFTPYPPSPGQNVSIPTTTGPNAAIYAFWDNLIVDASASMRTATLGRAPDRQFVIEWRNVALASDPASRINAEVVLREDGSIVLNYDLLDNAAERGQSATVGIENPAGQVGLRYSYNQPVLANRTAVVFTPPASTRGTLTGTVTVAGVAVAGATVSLLPAGLTTTTADDGTFTFTTVLAGSYTLRATTSGDGCGAVAQVPVVVTADETTTLSLTAHERCTAGPTPS